MKLKQCSVCGQKETLWEVIKQFIVLESNGYVNISGKIFCSYDCYHNYINGLDTEELLEFAEHNKKL